MNAKSMLIAAAVLATPACAVSQNEVAAASEDAIQARVSLLGETYLSRDTFQVTQYRRHPDGEYVADTIVVRYRLRFIPAGVKSTKQTYGDYSYKGEGSMEYETVLDQVEEGKPELRFSDDMTYYAKRTGGGAFRLFDCDSTRRCADGDRVSQLDVSTTGGKKLVTISGLNRGDFQQPGIFLDGVPDAAIVFEPTHAAPEHVALPRAVTCSENGRTLTLSPASSERADIELRDDATSTVLDRDDYSVVKDHLGRYFVVGAWSGLRISLGERSARYENEITGLTVDFAAGACTSLE